MRCWQWVIRSRFVLMIMMLAFTAPHVLAQDTEWTESEPLTLVWQTAFTEEAMLLTPGDIAVDEWGTVFVSTQGFNTIKKFDSDGNFVTQWGEHGTGDGQFNLSLGVALDADGSVYVTDFYNHRIQKFDAEGGFLFQWATEPSTSPAFMDIDADGNVYVDQFPPRADHYVQKFDLSGNLLSEWGSGGREIFDGRIEDVAVDADGNLYVADPVHNRVQKLDPDGALLATFGGKRSRDGNGQFQNPFGVTVDADGNVYVLDSNYLQKLDWDGNFIAQWSTDSGDLDRAANVRVDSEGYLYLFAYADVTAANGNEVNTLVLKKFQQP
jgi:tripartite motif-containing protein 71